MSIKKCRYELHAWQGLLEQIVNLAGHGYYYYHISYVPETKTNKIGKIDKKMIEKYRLEDQTKNTRYRRKQKGLANFVYLRWFNIIVVLRTQGDVIDENGYIIKHGNKSTPKDIVKKEEKIRQRFNPKQAEKYQIMFDDPFQDLRQNPIILRISDQVSFNVQSIPKKDREKEPFTVKFTKSFFKDKKAELAELVEKKAKRRVIDVFKNLNGVPSWRGIIVQKWQLQKFILHHSSKHGLNIKRDDLPITNYRKPSKQMFVQCDDALCKCHK